MKLLSTACLVLCLGAALRADAQTTTLPGPTVWSGNGHMYELTTAKLNWNDAEAAAELMGGRLASINSAAEQNFVVSTFLADTATTSTLPLWIGLTDQPNYDSQSYTTWTTGEPVTYTNFFAGEPNNQHTDEDYVALNWHYSFGSSDTKGTWNDLPLNGSTENFGGNNARALGPYYGIVEIVPEPSTVWLLTIGVCAVIYTLRRRRLDTASSRLPASRRD